MAPLEAVASDEEAGLRTDRFLAGRHADLSRSRVKAMIEEGLVWRDDRPARSPAEPVRAGSRFEIRMKPPVAADPRPEAIPFPILHEDDDLIVLDKPAGLVVHPAPGNEEGTLVNALLAHCGDSLPGIGGEKRPGIVHRLDKDTSGLMVVAKTEASLARLSADFAARDIDRLYLAICWGVPGASGTIEGAIGRDPRDRKRMAVVARGGKPALTRFQRLRVAGTAASLLACKLATGRTHQIRVHLATDGHPLVGDPVYLRRIPAAARGLPDLMRATALDFPRQALHAARLGFHHPRTGRHLLFETMPPADFQLLHEAVFTEAMPPDILRNAAFP
ncbi:RluA family pseudouridine synthase [Acetobacteraceae bacterium KSS12]|uniref:Pseudouridine synthase n=2 Tax=Rhizosaccharibacter radicis TaxID=2782605 RepID=A0ABT1VXV1_9PROT|nr:RluA family pseudouridine synthase [Acetobacteraceae bacterium KSS12]